MGTVKLIWNGNVLAKISLAAPTTANRQMFALGPLHGG